MKRSIDTQRLPFDKPTDLTPLTDINWVHIQLEALANSGSPSSSTSSRPSATTPLRNPSAAPATRFPSSGSGSSTPNGLGRTTEAMGRLDLGLGAEGESLRERKRSLPKWEAEGVKLEVLELPIVGST